MNLIFCGQNGERVKIKCRPRPSDQNEEQVKSQFRSVKPTIMVLLNKKKYEEIVFRVDEINKRTLGRLIISLCGNEGAEETTEQTGLRRLLQAFITKIEDKPITGFNNIKLSLYGKDSMSFHILAGKSHHPKLIVGYVDSKGDFHINEKQTSYCTIS
ncbi:uncharacterized protein LOC117109017 [Anneissia japonica]|uniref:uncharacterized protein LOC117109017 n=1 Tax=Anneissia japonica TaxID=1529436 RepID=UPI0014254DC9|nr:uncharacterized protein LOC117109017 [Anneissia japonica]